MPSHRENRQRRTARRRAERVVRKLYRELSTPWLTDEPVQFRWAREWLTGRGSKGL